LTAAKGAPYNVITNSTLRDYPNTTVDNHGIHQLPHSELENVKKMLLRICRGISIETEQLIIDEYNHPLIEIVGNDGSLTAL
jgi:hypothetical protein